MTAIQYLSAFRLYGVDVLLLALGVTLVTSILKKTVCKSFPKKIWVIAPFAFGFVVYAVYRAIVCLDATPFTVDLGATLEGGFAVGCAATLYYVVYKQFFKTNSASTGLLAPLLEGLVKDEDVANADKVISEGFRDLTDEELFSFVRETLLLFNPDLDELTLSYSVKLIVAYLKTVGKTK